MNPSLLCAEMQQPANALQQSVRWPSGLSVRAGDEAASGTFGIESASKFGCGGAVGGSRTSTLANRERRSHRQQNDKRSRIIARKMGGAQVDGRGPSSKAMSELFNGLGPNGKLMVIGAAFEPIEVAPVQLINGSRAIQGWASGTPADAGHVRFAELSGVRPMIETYPLEKAAEAYARMMSGNAQFRVVRGRLGDIAGPGRTGRLSRRRCNRQHDDDLRPPPTS